MWIKCTLMWIFFLTVERIFVLGLPLQKTDVNHLVFQHHEDGVVDFVPQCSNNRTFCEDVDIYPEKKFYTILKQSPYEQEYFSSQSAPEGNSVSNRFHLEGENYICNSRRKQQYPRVARNIKNEWKFVYNFDRYKQKVVTEECIGDTCTSFQGAPKDVKTKCFQKYSDALLLVADKDGEPVWDLFYFPSACLCSYEPIINFNFI